MQNMNINPVKEFTVYTALTKTEKANLKLKYYVDRIKNSMQNVSFEIFNYLSVCKCHIHLFSNTVPRQLHNESSWVALQNRVCTYKSGP